MTLEDMEKHCAGMLEEALTQLEADFSGLFAALIVATDEGFAQAQADLDQQRGDASG